MNDDKKEPMHHDHELHGSPPAFWRSRYGIGLIVFGAFAAYFLVTEHRAHVVGALPLLILLACPLMHVFMHHGHGGHGHHQQDANPTDEDVSKPAPPKPGDSS